MAAKELNMSLNERLTKYGIRCRVFTYARCGCVGPGNWVACQKCDTEAATANPKERQLSI